MEKIDGLQMVKNLIFDLDNTIYPSSSKINDGIDFRMIQAVEKVLGVSFDVASKLRSEKKKLYSSTLEWLMKEHHFTDIDFYLHFVHPENEIEELPKVDGLVQLFSQLKIGGYKMTVLTNGPAFHAERVLDFYGISSYFTGIHDIIENGMKGKPYENSYLSCLEKENFTLNETIFIDDYPKYVKGYLDLGGKAVLIDLEEKLNKTFFENKNLFFLHSVFELPNLIENLDTNNKI